MAETLDRRWLEETHVQYSQRLDGVDISLVVLWTSPASLTSRIMSVQYQLILIGVVVVFSASGECYKILVASQLQ